MIDVVIEYEKESGMYKVYEPTSDTLLITTNLTDSFLKLSEFLHQSGMIPGDILGSNDIRYHIDSATFLAMIESNVALLKRLNQAPSGFTIASQRFGQSQNTGRPQKQQKNGKQGRPKFKSGNFSKSSFNNSYKKFGGYDN